MLSSKMGNCMETDKNTADFGDHKIAYGENVHKIVSEKQWNEKMSEAKGKKVIVNFSASWCGPCISISPFYAELSAKYPSIIFLAVDVDELADLSLAWDVQATPTFFFIQDGQKLDKHVGSDRADFEQIMMKFAN
ncbi:thioredoxin H4-1-like isoform X2 [Canna indica]|uniref:Thioredoxin H4-1-like isoform X2 n=1 Tax=Canna indica TaxID=4628 RepID=A0AAQ3Q3R7_9LILI|nr:thioredoxin H4-1-like isoform X2 [Canna indica]